MLALFFVIKFWRSDKENSHGHDIIKEFFS